PLGADLEGGEDAADHPRAGEQDRPRGDNRRTERARSRRQAADARDGGGSRGADGGHARGEGGEAVLSGQALEQSTKAARATGVDLNLDGRGPAVELVDLATGSAQLRQRGGHVGPHRDVDVAVVERLEAALQLDDLPAGGLGVDIDADPLAVQRGQLAADLGDLAIGVRGVRVELDVRERLDGAADPPLHVLRELADLALGLLRVDVDLGVGALPVELLQLVGDAVDRVRESFEVARVALAQNVETEGLGHESPASRGRALRLWSCEGGARGQEAATSAVFFGAAFAAARRSARF